MEGNNPVAPNPGPGEVEEFDASALIGQTIAGRYEILKKIGRGGMGVVYLAQQSNLSRKVVIKMLAPNLVDDRNALARFEREARGLSRLQHPNIVTIFDFGRDGDQAYIAMEYVDGHTLSRHLKRHGPLKLVEFAPIAVQILKGIGEAHKLGLIHRDVKPTNIMLCELEGQPNFVKILDFGLAKLVRNPTEVTKEQHLVGSAAFLAPEQILNGVSNPRSDVYALGVLFYLMLSGKRPFKADNDAVLLYKHVNEEPPPLSRMLPAGHDIPAAVIRLIESCLNKDPDERPGDANALLSGLTDCLATSLTSMPWMSGEFAAVNNPSPRGLMTPNIDDVKLAADTDDQSHSAAIARHLETHSSIEELSRSLGGQSVIMVAPPDNSKRNLLVTVVVVSLIAAIAVAAAMALIDTKPSTAEVAAPDQNKIEETLTTAGNLIEEKKWGQAEKMLDSIEADLGRSSSSMMARGAALRDELAVGRLMDKASRQLEGGDVSGAVATLDEVLELDATYQEAIDQKSELAPLLAAQPHGILAIDTGDLVARVYIDGSESGTTPISVELPPGPYDVRVEGDGFEDWEKSVTVSEGTEHRYDLDLASATANESTVAAEPVVPPAPVAKARPKGKKKKKKKKADEKVEPDTTEVAIVPPDPPDETKKDEKKEKKKGGGLLLPVGKKKTDEKKEKKKGGLLLPVGSK